MRILLPIDGSQAAHRAVRHVVNRARRDAELEVELVGIKWPSLPEGLGPVLPPVRLGGSPATRRERDARAMLAMHHIPFRMYRVVGDPASAIAELAVRRECSEIVMGRLGSNGIMRRFLYSLPDRIAGMAWRRVTVVD